MEKPPLETDNSAEDWRAGRSTFAAELTGLTELEIEAHPTCPFSLMDESLPSMTLETGQTSNQLAGSSDGSRGCSPTEASRPTGVGVDDGSVKRVERGLLRRSPGDDQTHLELHRGAKELEAWTIGRSASEVRGDAIDEIWRTWKTSEPIGRIRQSSNADGMPTVVFSNQNQKADLYSTKSHDQKVSLITHRVHNYP
ncbi:unnamed protein product [Protopolystoma xenopodis]|uniref:Uncharacterized protein n=1 Tax=Protopolystoma xenopodis TaxID=117903 RepID=A0A448XHT1_9PLAT|nr:unnamed protein product [Protopolystoma xenopodis]